jgi:hypothetical protein
MEKEIKRLMLDNNVTKKSGIYPYLITKDEKYLNIRGFPRWALVSDTRSDARAR